MPITIEYLLLAFALLLFISVIASKASDRLGVPALLLFLFIGMLAGGEGFGLHWNQPAFAKSIGIVALAFILFTGGLDTHWSSVRTVLKEGLLLATLGVILTAAAVGIFTWWVLKFPLRESILLGAIVSSTDAAAVFSVLRSRQVGLKGNLRPLLEFESGSNDPMAVFLTLGLLSLSAWTWSDGLQLVPRFLLDMGVGAAMGWVMPRFMLRVINRLKLEHEGLYPVLTLSLVLLTYAVTTALHGNGFLAVYMAGLHLGNSKFLHKKTLKHFHEGLGWLMQIIMFLALGLLVVPSQLWAVSGTGLLISLFLILVARPLSVWVCLLRSRFTWRERAMLAWVGLRGAVPIILATFPLLAGIPQSGMIFNVVFFIVLTSILIQGTSVPLIARWLGVDEPLKAARYYPIEFEEIEGMDANIVDLLVPYQSAAVGRTLFELGLPKELLVVLISRANLFVIPNGSTRLEGGDVLLVLANAQDLASLQAIIAKQAKSHGAQ